MFIGVAGTIGAGKTAFTQELAQQLGYRPVFEPVEENPFLADFYADKSRWGLHSQLTFLIHKLHKQREITSLLKTTDCIQDRLIFEDFMFAKMLHDTGYMDARSHALYHQVVELCADDLFYPDLIIYLRVLPGVARQRIAARARDGEQLIDISYLQTLHREYERLITDFRAHYKRVLEIDWNEQRPLNRLLSRQTLFTIQERLI